MALQPGNKYGVLPVNGTTYGRMQLLESSDTLGRSCLVLTRGPGREGETLLVPIQVTNPVARSSLIKAMKKGAWPVGGGAKNGFKPRLSDYSAWLMRVPQPGNWVSGWWWSVPAWTRSVDEEWNEGWAKDSFAEAYGAKPLCVFPALAPWMQYTEVCAEVARLAIAITDRPPEQLPCGAVEWILKPVGMLLDWSGRQNRPVDPTDWHKRTLFCPVDGRVDHAVARFQALWFQCQARN